MLKMFMRTANSKGRDRIIVHNLMLSCKQYFFVQKLPTTFHECGFKMSEKGQQLDRQISAFLALRGHSDPKENHWQIFREMMAEINHLRMVVKNPSRGRERGRQPTANLDRERYQHLIGFLVFKHRISGEEAAEILSELCLSIDGGERSAKAILELASGWKTKHFLAEQRSLPMPERWKMHEEWLDELSEMYGDPEYFPTPIRNYAPSE
tara:strand:- start:526 stop:1152 length:627 start_codon:yes stop_codon:yes gene_type:complete